MSRQLENNNKNYLNLKEQQINGETLDISSILILPPNSTYVRT